MRQSYRDKRNRQARITQEEMEAYEERRKSQRRREDRRQEERRSGDDRRKFERRAEPRSGFDRRIGERRADSDRRFVERRSNEDRRANSEMDINEYEDIVAGRNAVLVEVDSEKLNNMADNHQGVVAVVPPFNYCEVEDILDYAKEKNEDPFIIIFDGIEDPHNFGSIIRTAETAGVHGIIIPKRRNVAVNSTVAKVSTGATAYVIVARVNNLNETIKKLKDSGLWVIGTDGEADTLYYNQDLKGPLAIIIGSEGFGISKLVKENSDILIKIPMKGQITSLNAAVSTGIVIYEAVKQRGL